MNIDRLDVLAFPVPFKVVFRHASASRARAENVIVAVRSACGHVGYGEGCPRDYVTGETVETALEFIGRHRDSLTVDVSDIDDLRNWAAANEPDIERNPAAFCAVELALLDLIGKATGLPVEDVIGVPRLEGSFDYSAILGDSPYLIYWWQFQRYWRSGFRDFKVKASGNVKRDRRKIDVFRNRADAPLRVRLDANNLWRNAADCISHLRTLDYPFYAIEEPLQAGDLFGFQVVAAECDTMIVLDESFLGRRQLDGLDDPKQWIINVRVSKMGGLLRSIDVACRAQQLGIGVVVGA